MEKVWKMEIKSGKMVKSLEFFQSYDNCFIIFFGFGQILIDLVHTFEKKLCSCDFYALY